MSQKHSRLCGTCLSTKEIRKHCSLFRLSMTRYTKRLLHLEKQKYESKGGVENSNKKVQVVLPSFCLAYCEYDYEPDTKKNRTYYTMSLPFLLDLRVNVTDRQVRINFTRSRH